VLKKALAAAVILGVACIVMKSLPDIARYIKIREM